MGHWYRGRTANAAANAESSARRRIGELLKTEALFASQRQLEAAHTLRYRESIRKLPQSPIDSQEQKEIGIP